MSIKHMEPHDCALAAYDAARMASDAALRVRLGDPIPQFGNGYLNFRPDHVAVILENHAARRLADAEMYADAARAQSAAFAELVA